MKKLYSLIASALLATAAASAGVPTPYSSPIALNGATLDEGWTVIDANNDGKTWTTSAFNSYNGEYGMRYTYNSALAADEYVTSPAIALEEGKEYVIMYTYCGESSNSSWQEALEVLALEPLADDTFTLEDLQSATQIAEHTGIYGGKTWKNGSAFYTAPSTGDYHFSWHAISDKDKYGLWVGNVQIIENVFAPNPVSNLTAIVAPERELKISLSWTLPTKSTLGAYFDETQTVEKVEVFRDGGETPVATFNEAVTSFEDTADTGLTSGKHTYQVVVTVAGVASAPASVGPTAYCGPLEPTAVPADFALTNADDFSLFTVRKGEESTTTATWSLVNNLTQIYFNGGAVVDEWLITPPVAVETAGYYRIHVMGYAASAGAKLNVCKGSSTEVADMTSVGELSVPTGSGSNFNDCFIDTYIAEPGTYYFAANAAQGSDESSNGFYLGSVKVTTSKKFPNPVTALKATPSDVETTALLTWTCPATTFAGEVLAAADYNIEIIFGDEVIATLPGGTSEYTFTADEAGSYTLGVRTVLTDGAALDEYPTVKTGWVGPKIVPMPYAVDFNSTDDTIEMWAAYNGLEDGDTWVYVPSTSGWVKSSYQLKTEAAAKSDNALVSPLFELTPGYYKLRYNISAGNSWSTWAYETGLVKAGEYGEDRQWVGEKNSATYGSSSEGWRECQVQVTEDGLYQFVLASVPEGTTLSGTSYLPKLYQFSIEKLELLPTVATDVTVTPGEDHALEATISWTNPTSSNISGVELQEGDIVKAVIYRDGEEIATVTDNLIPGETSSYVDTEVTPGKHTYKVELFTESGRHEANAGDVYSAWIGGGLPIPYVAQDKDTFGLWTVVNANGDSNWMVGDITWKINGNMFELTSSSTDADDWVISPMIQFDEGKIYKIEVTTSGGYSNVLATSLDVHMGDNVDNYADFQKIGTIDINEENTRDNPVVAELYVEAVNPEALVAVQAEEGEGEGETDPTDSAVTIPAGVNHIGIHAFKKSDLRLFKTEVTVAKDLTTGVENVAAGTEVALDGTTLVFAGKADVTVFTVSGALVAAQHNAEGSVDLSTLESGIYLVRVAPENGKAVTLKVAL